MSFNTGGYMAKDWGERWGNVAREKGSNYLGRSIYTIWDEDGNLKPAEEYKQMYISDGTRAVKLSEALVNNIKARLLLGLKVIKVPKQTMYYTAQLKTIEYANTITLNGHTLRARAVMPFRGTWEFIVVSSSK